MTSLDEKKRSPEELKERAMRLISLMKYYSVKQEELAHRGDCSQGLIGKLLRAEIQSSKHLYIISRNLPCDYEWLEYGKGYAPWEKPTPITTWEQLREIEPKNIKEPFVLPVKGHAMEDSQYPHRSFYSNQKIKVDPSLSPSDGLFVIALLKNNELVLRRYSEEAGEKLLIALNKNYKPIPVDDIIKIYGVVTQRFEELLTVA